MTGNSGTRSTSASARSRARLVTSSPSRGPAVTVSPHYVGDCADHVLDVLISHARVEGQRQNPHELRVGHGDLVAGPAVLLAVVGVQVEGDEVHAHPDPPPHQLLDELVTSDGEARQVQPEYVEVPSVVLSLARLWKLQLVESS